MKKIIALFMTAVLFLGNVISATASETFLEENGSNLYETVYEESDSKVQDVSGEDIAVKTSDVSGEDIAVSENEDTVEEPSVSDNEEETYTATDPKDSGYGIWIGEEQFSTTKTRIYDRSDEGYADYDPASGTITFTDFKDVKSVHTTLTGQTDFLYIGRGVDKDITLKGKASIRSYMDGDFDYGIGDWDNNKLIIDKDAEIDVRSRMTRAVHATGTLEINGKITASAIAENAHAIEADELIINEGSTVSARTEGDYSFALYARTKVQINGGTIEVSASGEGTICIGGSGSFSYIQNGGSTELVANQYDKYKSAQGIVSGDNGTITFNGGYLHVFVPKGNSGVHSDKEIILSDKTYLSYDRLNDQKTDIVDKNGTVSNYIFVYHPDWYSLWVGGVQINSENARSLSEGIAIKEGNLIGYVQYDPEKNILNCEDVGGITGAYTVSGETYKIYCDGDLIVTGNAYVKDTDVDHVIGCSGKLTIQGELDLSSADTAVTADEIYVDAINLNVKSDAGAALEAVTKLELSDNMKIKEPEGGSVDTAGKTIADSSGATNISEVNIIDARGKQYDIWIGGERLTSLNMDKVPGIKGGGSLKAAEDAEYSGRMILTFEGNVTGTDSLYTDGDGKSYYIYSMVPILIRGDAQFTNKECSNGIYSEMDIDIEGNITVSGTECAVCSEYRPIYVENGGVLDATSGGDCAIKALADGWGQLDIDNGEVRAKCTKKDSSAIWVSRLYFTSGKIIAEGDKRAVNAELIDIDEANSVFIIPAGGSVNSGQNEILEADGTTYAKKIHIEKEYAEVWYGLYVGRYQVNSNNKDAIPGILGGGSASYDPDTHTLTFTGKVTGVEGYSYGIYDQKQLICCFRDEMNPKGDLTINGNASFYDSNADYGIYLSNTASGKLVINGDIELHTYSIPVLATGDIEINGNMYAISEKGSAIRTADGNIVINGNVKLRGGKDNYGLDAKKSIIINDGSVETVGLSVEYGEIIIDEGLRLLLPEGGRLSDDKKNIFDRFGSIADNVMIGKAKADHRVKFDLKGHGEKADVIVKDGSVLMKPADPTEEGFTFAGWYSDEKCTIAYNFNSFITSDITIYAKWIKGNVTLCSVDFVMCGFGNSISPQKVQRGKKAVRPEDPTDPERVFTGWYEDAVCSKKFDFNRSITADTSVFAGWEEMPEEGLEVSFVFNDGLSYNAGAGRYEHFYTGSKIEPAITVVNRREGKAVVLTENIDYTIKYSNNVNVDKKGKPATLTITGKGDYKGTKKLRFYILPVSIGNGTDATPSPDIRLSEIKVKSGDKASPVMYYGSYKLTSKDFLLKSKTGSLKFSEADLTSDRKLTIIGKGNFSGSIVEADVTVLTAKEVKNNSVKATVKSGVSRVYDGSEQILSDGTELVVTDGTGAKLEPTDYDTVYSANVNAGTAKVTVIGKNGYTGTSTKTFKIKPDKDRSTVTVLLAESFVSYRKQGAKPKVAVTSEFGGIKRQLIAGRDYKVTYSSNKSVTDKAKYTVSFTGNYKGRRSLTKTFKIVPAAFNSKIVTVNATDMIYKKPGKYTSAPIVTKDGELLGSEDYTVTYLIDGKDITNERKLVLESDVTWVDVIVKGKGNYEAVEVRAPKCYSIRKTGTGIYDLSKAKITMAGNIKKNVPTMEYTGVGVFPEFDVWVKVDKTWVTLSDLGLKRDVDYTVSYANNISRGKGTIIISSLSSKTAGSKSVKFTIGQRKLSSLLEKLRLLDNKPSL